MLVESSPYVVLDHVHNYNVVTMLSWKKKSVQIHFVDESKLRIYTKI